MYTAACKNSMLNANGITHVSLHDSYPGLTGANEFVGGTPTYARQAISFAAAVDGAKASSLFPILDVPSGRVVRWVGFWNAASGGTFLGFVPNGGIEREITIDVAANTILYVAHAYPANKTIAFYGTLVPATLVAGVIYYVVNPTADSFQVALTASGAPIDLTAPGSYDCVVSGITEETFGAQGQHRIAALSLNLNG